MKEVSALSEPGMCSSPKLYRQPSLPSSDVPSGGYVFPQTTCLSPNHWYCECDFIWKQGLCTCSQVKMRSYWPRRALNPMTGVLIRGHCGHGHRDTQEHRVSVGTEAAVICLQAKDCGQSPRRRGMNRCPSPPEGTKCARLDVRLWSPDCKGRNACCLC